MEGSIRRRAQRAAEGFPCEAGSPPAEFRPGRLRGRGLTREGDGQILEVGFDELAGVAAEIIFQVFPALAGEGEDIGGRGFFLHAGKPHGDGDRSFAGEITAAGVEFRGDAQNPAGHGGQFIGQAQDEGGDFPGHTGSGADAEADGQCLGWVRMPGWERGAQAKDSIAGIGQAGGSGGRGLDHPFPGEQGSLGLSASFESFCQVDESFGAVCGEFEVFAEEGRFVRIGHAQAGQAEFGGHGYGVRALIRAGKSGLGARADGGQFGFIGRTEEIHAAGAMPPRPGDGAEGQGNHAIDRNTHGRMLRHPRATATGKFGGAGTGGRWMLAGAAVGRYRLVMSESPWFHVAQAREIASPALLLFRERIEHNLQHMLAIAGGPERLRPHVKTHKLAELVRWQIRLGITCFKAATIAECEMCALAGARDVLLAMPCVGPVAKRLARLAALYPGVRFSTLAEQEESVRALAEAAREEGVRLGVFVEIDCGMGRTGLAPGEEAARLGPLIDSIRVLEWRGLHAYDGHLHDVDPVRRQDRAEAAFAPVLALRHRWRREGFEPGELVAGGSPTFGYHAARSDRVCSPGTCVLWDFAYAENHPDLPFLPAAVLLARVISKPGPDRLTLDLGHKAVAAENPHPRVRFVELPEAEALLQSEEHLVLRTPRASQFRLGQVLLGIPRHVCPTVALYDEALVIEGGHVADLWPITARQRRLSV